MKKFLIRKLDEDDKFAVSELRRRILRPEFPQVQDPVQFNWGPTDRNSWVLGAFQNEKLVSTLRLELLTSRELFESRLGILHNQLPIQLPVCITSRAVTDPDYQNSGLHSILKMFCFLKALREGASHCLAMHREDTPRAKSLAQIGYKLYLLQTLALEFPDGLAKNTLITLIDLKNEGLSAIDRIRHKYQNTLKEAEISSGLSMELNLSEVPLVDEP